MKEFTVVLSSINDVKNFVNVVTKYEYEIDLTSGRYVVDAKSIMGIFSLDLTKPIRVEAHGEDCSSLLAELDAYIQKQKIIIPAQRYAGICRVLNTENIMHNKFMNAALLEAKQHS